MLGFVWVIFWTDSIPMGKPPFFTTVWENLSKLLFQQIQGCEAALWGIFIADALSAPAHWYYDTAALMADYGTIRGYVAPKKKNSANRIMNNHWKANKHDICTLVDGGHMLHGKGRVWKEPYNHYHDSFQPGENTLNAQIARVLMRNMTMAKGRYDHETWCEFFKDFVYPP